jgi:hypothetical protein
LRKKHPAWGPERLKLHYNLPISTKAIARIIRQEGLVRKRKKKWKKKRDLREMKKKLAPFQMIEIDTKDLSDIEKYWRGMRKLRLPRYQFTAPLVRTGGEWISFGETKDGTNAAIFANYLLSQLEYYGVDLSCVIIQTDNDSEFIGSVQKKKGKSAFAKTLESFGVEHRRIPPRACTWQSDVEAPH